MNLTFLTKNILMLALVTTILVASSLFNPHVANAEVRPVCDQSRYISGEQFVDQRGYTWACRRNYAGRYVWYLYAPRIGDPLRDPECDDYNTGSIWQDYGGNFHKCEYTLQWVLVPNPFIAPVPAPAPVVEKNHCEHEEGSGSECNG